MDDPVPPDAPRTTTLLGHVPTDKSQSRQAYAVSVTNGMDAAASCERQLGFLATGVVFGLMVIY
jgi:hypothetical protein